MDVLFDEEYEIEAFNHTMLPYRVMGFKKGIEQGLLQGGGKTALEDVFTHYVYHQLKQKTLLHASLAVGTTKETLQGLLTTAVEEGQSIDQLAKAIRDSFSSASKVRSLRIARTELTDTINDGTEQTLRKEGYLTKEWSTVIDSRERETHHQANGQTVGIHDFFKVGGESARYPGDDNLSAAERVNCFLPGTTIRGRVNLAMRSFYSGQAIEIVTALGNVLRVTQNHPVLTEHGFVPAGSLQEGDQLLSYVGDVHQRFAAGRSPPSNENHEPSVVEQVFRSLSAFNLREFPRVRSDHFHSDGRFSQGNIEIVGSYRKLLHDGEPGRLQDRRDLVLVSELAQLLAKERQGTLAFHKLRVLLSSAALPGRGALTPDRLGVALHAAPLQEFRFGASSDVCTRLFEDSADHSSIHPKLFRNLLLGHSKVVQGDRIKSLRRIQYRGHVYDVQSPVGWIVASNIVTSNCRCATLGSGLPEDRKRHLGRAFLRVHGALERTFVVHLRRAFVAQRDRVLSHFPQ